MKTGFNLLFFIPFCINTYAADCPNYQLAPKCPNTGIKILDETYPTQSFVISAPPGTGVSQQFDKVPSEFAMTIMESYDFKNVPQIIIVSDNLVSFEEIKTSIKQTLKKNKHSDKEIEKMLGQLSHANAPWYTFMQDPFISTFNESTGRPQVSSFESFNKQKNHKMVRTDQITAGIANSISKCGGSLAATLSQDLTSIGSSEMGGNIQALPGGICLVGNNLGETISNKICGDPRNIFKANVTWLEVGHVDEILKVIPTHNRDGRPNECQFAILSASPKKALDLLSQASYLKRKYFNFPINLDKKELFKQKMAKCSSPSQLIEYTDNISKKKFKEIFFKEKNEETKIKSVFLKFVFPLAVADDAQSVYECEESETIGCYNDAGNSVIYAKTCVSQVEEMTNEDFLKEFNSDQRTAKFNKDISNAIEEDVRQLEIRILERLPQCKPYLKNISVPNLFYFSMRSANSFNPNPTNAVIANKSLIFSDTLSEAFNSYLLEEVAKVGLKGKMIDTWEFAHIGGGELHCATHSLNYCSPERKK